MSAAKKDEENGPQDQAQKKGMTLDQILVEEVGQFGRYQLYALALASLPVIFAALAAGEFIFTTARINTRCLIPECESGVPEWSPSWLEAALPGSGDGFDNCQRYNRTIAQTTPPPMTCPSQLFNQQQTIDCPDGYVYENTYSVVYDFDMGCDEWRRSLIGSVRMFGTLFVLPITGFISDRWGRRVALTINAFNKAWIGLARSFVPSYEWFVALEFLEASVGSGAYPTCYILAMELVGAKYRVLAGASMSTIYAVGQIFLGLIAWAIRPWTTLTQVLYVPQLLVVSYFWIMAESVRWLLIKGRYDEAEKILKKAAKTNKKSLSDESFKALRTELEKNKMTGKEDTDWLPLLVIKSKVILFRCCVTPIWWITNNFVNNGININSVNFSGNGFLNYVYVAAVAIPGYWTAILLLDRIGRKPVLISGYFVCAACQFGFAFLPENASSYSLFLYLLGKFSIAMVMTSVYMYTIELYPTRYRQSLLAFSTTIGSLGSIVAPLTPALAQSVWEPLPSVLFGCFALLSGLLVFTTPETLGSTLPDTMEEAANLSLKKQTNKTPSSND